MASDNATQLESIQRWFHASITHPGGSREGVESDLARQSLPVTDQQLEDILLPSNALQAIERLSIYADMYFERLIEIMAEEFPSVRHLIGPQIFADAVKVYITHHPSTHYDLARLGREFPQFLFDEGGGLGIPNRKFAAALATVERTMEVVFDEQQLEPLTIDELQAIPAEHWDRVRLKTISALRLLKLPYAVNEYISAVRDKRSINVPDAGSSFIVIYRVAYRVWRMDLEELQFTLLSELQNGRTLGEALGLCAERCGESAVALAESLHEWFRNWTTEGFFHKIDIDSL